MSRPAGTPNKKSLDLKAMIESAVPGFDPCVMMAKGAHFGVLPRLNPTTGMMDTVVLSEDARTRMCVEVAKYMHAQRKAVELSGEVHQTGGVLMVESVKSAEQWLSEPTSAQMADLGIAANAAVAAALEDDNEGGE